MAFMRSWLPFRFQAKCPDKRAVLGQRPRCGEDFGINHIAIERKIRGVPQEKTSSGDFPGESRKNTQFRGSERQRKPDSREVNPPRASGGDAGGAVSPPGSGGTGRRARG